MILQAEIATESAQRILDAVGTFQDPNVQLVFYLLISITLLSITVSVKFYIDKSKAQKQTLDVTVKSIESHNDTLNVVRDVSNGVKQINPTIKEAEGRISERIHNLKEYITT